MRHAERAFGGTRSEVTAARYFVRTFLRLHGGSTDEAELVAGELAANSLIHARSGFTVRLQIVDEGILVVEVTDESPALPSMRAPGSTVTTGRGLRIVDHLAKRWGTRPHPAGGKTIWVELDTGQP